MTARLAMSSAPPVDLVPAPRRRRAGGWPGWLPIVLGLWLAISIFLWPHTRDSQLNTWLVGVLVAGIGSIALYVPWLARVNVVLAVWLGASAIALQDTVEVTSVNNVVVAIGVLLAAVFAPGPRRPASDERTV